MRAAAQSTLYCLSVRPSVQGSRAGGSPTDKRDNKRLAPRYREEEEGKYEHKDVLRYTVVPLLKPFKNSWKDPTLHISTQATLVDICFLLGWGLNGRPGAVGGV